MSLQKIRISLLLIAACYISPATSYAQCGCNIDIFESTTDYLMQRDCNDCEDCCLGYDDYGCSGCD